jgi:hypothetical protein cdiviTM7_00170
MADGILAFILRWLLNSFGIWLSVKLFGTGLSQEPLSTMSAFIVAGLVFSIVNAMVRPIVLILSLPALLITMGLFIIVINGFMVWLALAITPGIGMTFSHAILTGIVLSVVNWVVSGMLQVDYLRRKA